MRDYADDRPLFRECLEELFNHPEEMNGIRRLIDGGSGDPIELWLAEDKPGEWIASLLQSNGNDHVVITGRVFRTVGELNLLLDALGCK
jgi:hypothetical protein